MPLTKFSIALRKVDLVFYDENFDEIHITSNVFRSEITIKNNDYNILYLKNVRGLLMMYLSMGSKKQNRW
jgi:hypothetical protein